MKDGDLRLCGRRSSVPVIPDQSSLSVLHSIVLELEAPILDELLLRGVLILRQNLHIGH